ADPSRRNSGLEATVMSAAFRFLAIKSAILRHVPAVTVDLITTTVAGLSGKAICRAADLMKERSICPSARGGVPTARKTISADLTQSSTLEENLRVPRINALLVAFSRPGSKIGSFPVASFSRRLE